jgi:hypothetical protein
MIQQEAMRIFPAPILLFFLSLSSQGKNVNVQNICLDATEKEILSAKDDMNLCRGRQHGYSAASAPATTHLIKTTKTPPLLFEV